MSQPGPDGKFPPVAAIKAKPSKAALEMRGKRRRRKKWNGIKFVVIDHPVLDSAAFMALSGAAAKAMLLLLRRWTGSGENNNNGEIPLSVRDIKAYCHVRSDRALEVRRELAASGLAMPTQPGAFAWKARHATTWRIAFLPTATDAPDWTFAKPGNLKVGTRSGNRGVPAVGTDDRPAGPKRGSSVPAVGTDSEILGTRSGNTCNIYHSPAVAENAPPLAVPVPKPQALESSAQSTSAAPTEQQREDGVGAPQRDGCQW